MDDVKELRQMPEIQNIAEYLRGMTFRKKTFGGYDIESVYEHFSAVTQMYEAIISAYVEQVDRYARELAVFQVRPEGQPPAAPQQMQQAMPMQQQAPQQPVQQPVQPVQQPYIAQNPWAPAWPASPWAQQPAPQQAYYDYTPHPQPPPQQAYSWQNEPEGQREPMYMYA